MFLYIVHVQHWTVHLTLYPYGWQVSASSSCCGQQWSGPASSSNEAEKNAQTKLLPPWHCTGWSKLLLLLPPFVFLRLPEFKETPPMTLSSRVFHHVCASQHALSKIHSQVGADWGELLGGSLHIIAPSRTGWLAFNPQTLWVLGVLLTWVWPSTDA